MFDSMSMGRFEVELGADHLQLKRDMDRAKAQLGGDFAEMQSMARNLNGLLGGLGLGIGVGTVVEFGRALLDAKIQAEGLRSTLDFASGGRGAQELEYLRRKTQELGLEFQTTAAAYAKSQAAARGTSLEGQRMRDVFESIIQTSSALNISAANTEGILGAVTQMVSKGTVQAEELRGQLGERLPGAFQIAARAMGVTTEQLGKMLEQGEVLASDFLPKFGRQLRAEVGDAASAAADRTEAAVNRLKNAWGQFLTIGGEGAGGDFLKGEIKNLAFEVEYFTEALKKSRAAGEGIFSPTAAAAVWELINPLRMLGEGVQDVGLKLNDAERELTELQAKFAKEGGFYLGMEVEQARRLVEELRKAKAAKDALEQGKVAGGQDQQFGAASSAIGALAKQGLEDQAKAQQLLTEARNKGLGVDGQYMKQLMALHALRSAEFADNGKGLITEKQYAETVQALTAATYKKTDADKADREEYLRLIASSKAHVAEMQAQVAGVDKLTEGERKLLELQAKVEQGTLKYEQALYRAAAAQLQLDAARERGLQLQQRIVQADQAAAKAHESEYLATVRSTKALLEQVRDQRAANDGVLDGVDHVGKLAAAKLREAANTQELLAIKVEEKNLDFALGQQYRDNAAALRALADAKGAYNELQQLQAARAELDAFLDPAKAQTFGEALTNAFGEAGNGLAQLSNALQDYSRKQAELDKMRRLNEKEADPIRKAIQERQLIEKQGELQVETYAQMAGAAKSFFDEGSRGYKALETAEAAFRAYQLASDLIKGISAAKVAIMSQAQGEPYTAIPRMLVMAGLAASLGYATGFLGSSGSAGPSAASRQAATGTGTVLGDPKAKSESIANSLELLEDSARIELRYQSEMLDSLRSIEASIGGLANLVLRTTGLTTGKNLGIFEGTLSQNRGDPILDGLGLSFLNDGALALPGLGGVIGDLQKLWGKVTQSITDSGLSINGTLSELAGGRGVQQYADVATTTSSFFGLKKSTSSSTVFNDVDEAIAKQFGLVFDAIGDTLLDAAGALGRDGDAVSKVLSTFVVDIDRLSLKDLKGSELQEAITAAIGAASDKAAQAAITGLDQFQKVGEGYFETIVRVAAGVETADYELERFGITAIAYADVLRKQGDVGAEIVRESITKVEQLAGGALTGVGEIIDTLDGSAGDLADTYATLLDVRAAMRLVGLQGQDLDAALLRAAGGMDELQSNLDGYFEHYFSATERAAAETDRLRTQFGKLGHALPDSREDFRRLVETLSASGDAAAGAVLSFEGAFDELMSAREEQLQQQADLEIQLLRAQGKAQQALALERQRELAALRELNPALADLQQKIYDAEDAAREADITGKFTVGGKTVTNAKVTDPGLLSDFQSAIDSGLYDKLFDRWGGQENVPGIVMGAQLNDFARRAGLNGMDDPQVERLTQQMAEGAAAWKEWQEAEERRHADELEAAQDLVDALRGLRETLADYRDDLLLGDMSALGPEQMYERAKAAFDEASAAALANAGDERAIEQLRNASDDFVRLSRSYQGHSGQAIDFAAVVKVLDAVDAKLAGLQRTGEKSLAVAAEAANTTIDAIRQGTSAQQRLVSVAEMEAQRRVS